MILWILLNMCCVFCLMETLLVSAICHIATVLACRLCSWVTVLICLGRYTRTVMSTWMLPFFAPSCGWRTIGPRGRFLVRVALCVCGLAVVV